MKVKINDQEIKTFSGAKVEDAVRSYSLEMYKKIKNGDKTIRDKYGNQVMLSGELTGGEKLYIE